MGSSTAVLVWTAKPRQIRPLCFAGTEHWYPVLIDVVNVSITNNLCVGTSRCVGGYSMGHHSSGIRVEGNTMWNIRCAPDKWC